MQAPKKILIVDDDYDFLESLQLLLMDDGHDTIAASNGTDAVQKYAEFMPDIVLLDFQMPGINGYETLLRIMEQDAQARIVFTSAYAIDNEQYRDAKARSLAGMLNKPIRLADLQKTIKKHAK